MVFELFCDLDGLSDHALAKEGGEGGRPFSVASLYGRAGRWEWLAASIGRPAPPPGADMEYEESVGSAWRKSISSLEYASVSA